LGVHIHTEQRGVRDRIVERLLKSGARALRLAAAKYSGGTLSEQHGKSEARRDLDDEYVRLLNRYKKPLFRLILCMVRNSSDADDIFQQSAITMWDKFGDFEPGSDFFAWACSIARFKVRDFVKSKARHKVYFSDEVIDKLAEESFAGVEELRLQALIECRKKLPQCDRELLAACYEKETSVVEFAERSKRSAGSIYSSLWRIRRTLHACIQRTMAREGFAR
jgi:RNA polymerase sigma-70 factor, ECF subfamily